MYAFSKYGSILSISPTSSSAIAKFRGENNYTYIHFTNGENVLVSRTLKDFEELLSDEGFIRVHQSHLVNKQQVKSFERSDGGYLKMNDGSTVSISRMRKNEVLKELSIK